MKEYKSDEHTPLSDLSRALCRKTDAQLFCNQFVMYRLLIPFISDNFKSSAPEYAPASVDLLIADIRRYLIYMYKHPSLDVPSDDEALFRSMHLYIYNNLTGSDVSTPLPAYSGNKKDLSLMTVNTLNYLNTNVSKIINNKRSLPRKWIKVTQENRENYTLLLYRCFWMLQYYFVYYEPKFHTISYDNNLLSISSSQFLEYFPLTDFKSKTAYAALSLHCQQYTSYFKAEATDSLNLLSLSRVILDTILEQTNLCSEIHLERITDASMLTSIIDKPIVTEQDQYMFYRTYIDGFDRDSIDRFHILQRFALTNCYAANELANMYLWGKTFLLRNHNYYELEIDHIKAIKWFTKAVENSYPPLQNACWCLAYALSDMRYATDEERRTAEAKAKDYLLLAGEYPAAYNRLAKFMFRDANALYREHGKNAATYKDILLQFRTAIQLADKAGTMHWFYGNNQIALFLKEHKDDPDLIADVAENLDLHVPFDMESQLKYSVSYQSPWAQTELALYYITHNRHKDAKPLLNQAMNANYNLAFYEAALHLTERGSDRWWFLMSRASEMSYPKATYELALLTSEHSAREQLIALCREQIMAEKQINAALLSKVNSLADE